jgi:hypothetical protein
MWPDAGNDGSMCDGCRGCEVNCNGSGYGLMKSFCGS